MHKSFLQHTVQHVQQTNRPLQYSDRIVSLPEAFAEYTVPDAYSMCALPNDYIAIGHASAEISIWDIKYLKRISTIPTKQERLYSLCAVQDSYVACSKFDSDSIQVYDWKTGICVAESEPFLNNFLQMQGKSSMFSFDHWLVTVGLNRNTREGTILISNVHFDTKKIGNVYIHHVGKRVFCVEPIGESLFAIGCTHGTIYILKLSLVGIEIVNTLEYGAGNVVSLALLPDAYLAACYQPRQLVIAWDLARNRRFHTLAINDPTNNTLTQVMSIGTGVVLCSNASEDLIAFNVKEQREIMRWRHKDVMGMVLHKSGVLACVSRRGKLKFYRVISIWTSGTRKRLLECHRYCDITVLAHTTTTH